MIIIISLFSRFTHKRYLTFIHWNMSESKSPQFSRTVLSIRVLQCSCLNGLDSTPDFQLFQSLFQFLVTLPSSLNTIGIKVTLMCYVCFFISLARSKYLSFFPLYFIFSFQSARTANSTIQPVLMLFFS